MAGRAMGWLGWTFDQVQATDVNAIELALNERANLLKALFGSKDENEGERGKPMTADRFKQFVARHNRSMVAANG